MIITKGPADSAGPQSVKNCIFERVVIGRGYALLVICTDDVHHNKRKTHQSRPPCQRGQLINCQKQFMSGGFSGRNLRIRPALRRIRTKVLRIPPTSLTLGHLPLTREAWVLPHKIVSLRNKRQFFQLSICFPKNSATVEARRWSDSPRDSLSSSRSIITQPRISPWQRMGAATPRWYFSE